MKKNGQPKVFKGYYLYMIFVTFVKNIDGELNMNSQADGIWVGWVRQEVLSHSNQEGADTAGYVGNYARIRIERRCNQYVTNKVYEAVKLCKMTIKQFKKNRKWKLDC